MKSRFKKQQIYMRYPRRIPLTDEDRAWLDMAPVGREFGSPDWDRFAKLDALADTAKEGAERAVNSIDETLQFVAESNRRIDALERRLDKSRK